MISKLGWRGLAALSILVIGFLVLRDLSMEQPSPWLIYGPLAAVSVTLALWPRPGG